MDLHFYLGGIETNIETNASITETLDKTLDTATVVLPFNSIKNCVAPMTPFKVKDLDTGETLNFVVITDNVEVVDKKNLKYKHSLTLTQNTRKMCKHILRNSTFEQPLPLTIKVNFGGANKYQNNAYNSYLHIFCTEANNWRGMAYTQKFTLEERMQIGQIKLYVDIETTLISQYSGGEVWEGNDYWRKNLFTRFQLYIEKYVNGVNVTTTTVEVLKSDLLYDEIGAYVLLDSTIFDSRRNTEYKITPYDNSHGQQDSYVAYMDTSLLPVPQSDVGSYPCLTIFNFKIVFQQVRYTLWDILNIISKQYLKYYNNANSRNAIYDIVSKSETKGAFLDSIIAPEFTFTGKDYFTAVSEILEYIDAVPVIDENNVLSFEYLNNRTTQATYSKADVNALIGEEHFNNKLYVQYQHAKQNASKYYPSRMGYCKTGIKELAMQTRNNTIIRVDNHIDYIDNVWINMGTTTFNIQPALWQGQNLQALVCQFNQIKASFNNDLDITDCIFESSVQSLLKIGSAENDFPLQSNTLSYTKGNKYIELGNFVTSDGVDYTKSSFNIGVKQCVKRFFGIFNSNTEKPLNKISMTTEVGNVESDDNFKSLARFRIKYHAIYDGQASSISNINKYDGEEFSSQTNSGVELGRLGISMFGLTSKLGNQTLSVSMPITSFDSRVKKGMYFFYDNDIYVANVIKTTLSANPNHCIQDVQFIKNYNELSNYIKLDREKRFFEIDTHLTSKGYDNIVEYVYFSTTPVSAVSDSNTALTQNALETIISGTLLGGSNYKKVDFAVIKSYSYENDNNNINLGKVNDLNTTYNCVEIPLHSYGFGNSICFEIGFDSPINAGVRFVDELQGSTHYYLGKNSLYTESNGYADKFDVIYVADTGVTTYWEDDQFPLCNKGTDPNTNLININNFKYYKRPNEIFRLNYQVAFVYNNQEFFFGEKFINENAIIRNSALDDNLSVKDLHIYTSDTMYSILDKKATGIDSGGNAITILPITRVGVFSCLAVIIDINDTSKSNYWCIADSDRNIYIASNKKLSLGKITFYVFKKRNRL